MQALLSKTRLPALRLRPERRAVAGARTQAAKSSGLSTETRSSILACCIPQYCAHWPRKIPVRCGSIHILFGWFGIRSVLPASSGTQKLWSVSAESKVRNVGVGCRGIAHRDVQLVRGNDAQLRIAKLPPVLMSDGGDLDGARGFGSILNRVDHSRSGQEQTRRQSESE